MDTGWLGDLPTWITTLAIAVAAAQFSVESKRRKSEENREAKAQAAQLAAWAVTDVESEPRVFGVVVSNSSLSTFHDVKIAVQLHNAAVKRDIELDILPPGDYFLKFNGAEAKFVWDFAIALGGYGGELRPYMKSEGYSVRSMSFADSLDQAWIANEHAVLTRQLTR